MKFRSIEKRLSLFLISILFILSSCQLQQDENFIPGPQFRQISSEHSGINFVNAIQENDRQNFLAYAYLYNGGGVAVGDLDNDGLADVYFTGNMAGDRLYHNQGDLKFKDLTAKSGILKQNLWTTGVTMADVNNDGFLDIYVCRSGDRGFRHNLLYINQGNLTFSEQARQWGVNDNGYSTQATFFDYDLDGDLDMYLVNHSIKFNFNQEEIFKNKNTPAPEEANQLYRNEGDQFTNVSHKAGIHRFAFGLSATVGDLNGDGYPDLYSASDFFEPDFLYINQKDGTFKECIQESTGHISFSSMGSDVADFNNDGLLDIIVADMRAEDHYRYHANMVAMTRNKFARMVKEGYHYQYMQNTLQLNQGINTQGLPIFSEIGQLAGISGTDWSWSTLFFDMDNNGWKDLFISNGIRRDIQNKDTWNVINNHLRQRKEKSFMRMQEYFPINRLQNYTFKNDQQLGFTNTSSVSGIDFKGFTNGAAYADLDNDGDLDLVLNNLDDPALIYENLARQNNKTQHHYLQIQLRGRKDNHFGLGVKVTLQYDDQQQFQELTTTRGFQSSVNPILHFGIGRHEGVDEITVTWPNGTYQKLLDVKADQKISIDQKDAHPSPQINLSTRYKPLFHSITPFKYVHKETAYDDFSHEPLLPFKLSSRGPCLAVGDVNGDHREDFYAGNGRGYASALFIQSANDGFKEQTFSPWQLDQQYKDVDAVFFDADQDRDLDLYVVSGSNEYKTGSPWLQDRLYINDGNGNFTRGVLPDIRVNSNCVTPADIDKDGDVDLFIGGGSIPGNYPLASGSYLLMNEKGTFSVTEIDTLGIVTDGVWADIDNDADVDLIVVGQWMPITLLENENGKLKNGIKLAARGLKENDTSFSQLQNTAGWWNCITTADLDQDGNLDLIVGNAGLNTRFSASQEEPLRIYAKDFDHNGSLEAIMGYYNQGQLYPVPGRDKLLGQIPSWQTKLPDYHTFAQTTMGQLLKEATGDSIVQHEVTQLASCILYNEGSHVFTLQKLPVEAQLSAVNDILVEDINQDGYMDLVMAGNHYYWEVETARSDAGIGLCLLREGKRTFRPLSLKESGFLASGDVRMLRKLNSVNGPNLILVGKNQGTLQIFALPGTSAR
jgi:enediyne biosynthesis protein E4